MIRTLTFFREKVHDWRALIFFFLLLALPLQKKIRIFKEFAASLTADFNFPAAMQKSFYFYLTDLALIGFVLIIIFKARDKIRELFFSGSAKYLTAFWGVALLSLLFSSTASCGLHYARLLHFFLLVAFFCALEQGLIARDLKSLFPKICTLFLFLALFQSAVGIAQYFLGTEVHLNLGEKAAHYKFPASQGKLWLLDASGHVSVIARAHGTFPHPNIFAGFLFISLLFSQFLFLREKEKFKRGLLAAALFLQVLTLFLTFSRAALLAYFLGSAVLLFYSRKGEWKALASVVFFSVLFSVLFLFPALQDRGGIFNYNATVQSSDQGRALFHEIAFNMIRAHPLLGVGYNHYLVHMQEFSPAPLTGDQFFPVHNIYLLVASETGLVGLLFFLLFCSSIVIRALKGEITLERAALLAVFLGFLLIGCFDFYLFSGTQHGRLLFFLTGGLLSFSAKRDNVTVN